jgi:hypothetical protein
MVFHVILNLIMTHITMYSFNGIWAFVMNKVRRERNKISCAKSIKLNYLIVMTATSC